MLTSPSGAVDFPQTPVLGRTNELEQLQSWWTDVVEARTSELALVLGESGVGKTRLAAEFTELVEAQGFRVLSGAASETSFLPYEAWAVAVRNLLASMTQDEVIALVEPHRSEIMSIPWLREVLPGPGGSHPGAPNRTAVINAVVGVLSTLSRTSPILVVLDDVHWCDVGSIEILDRVLSTTTSRCGIVALERRPGSRITSWGQSHPTPSLRLTVQRLPASTCGALLEYVAPGIASPDLTAAVHAASGGNPFVMLSLAMLAGRSSLNARDLAASLPRTATAIWAARLAPLSLATQDVLDRAAVIGTAFDVEWLSRSIGDPQLVDAALREARAAGLLAAETDHPTDRFSHALVRDYVYNRMTTTRRRRVHRSVAAVLTETDGGTPSERSGQLAHHWRESGPSGQPEAVAYTVAAARWAFDQGATTTARLHAEEALEGLGVLETDAGASTAFITDRRAALGDLLLQMGDARAEGLMLEAVEYYDTNDDVDGLARATDALLRAGQPLGSPAIATALAEDLVSRIDDVEPGLRSRVLARLVRAHEGRDDAGMIDDELSAKALGLARESGDAATLAVALLCQRAGRPWTDQRLELSRELVELGRRERNAEMIVSGLVAVHTGLVERGDLAGANAALAEAVMHQSTVPVGNAGVLRNGDLRVSLTAIIVIAEATRAQFTADVTSRQLLVDRISTMTGTPGQEQERLAVASITHQGVLAHDRGDLALLADIVVLFADEQPDSVQRRLAAAFVLAEAGRLDEADVYYRPIVERGGAFVPNDQSTSFMLILLAGTAARLRDKEHISMLEQRMAPFSGRSSCFIGGSMGPVDAALAELATCRGDLERAFVLTNATLEQCQPWGESPFLARAYLGRSRVLDELHSRSDAIPDATRARDVAQRLGMQGVANDAAAFLASERR